MSGEPSTRRCFYPPTSIPSPAPPPSSAEIHEYVAVVDSFSRSETSSSPGCFSNASPRIDVFITIFLAIRHHCQPKAQAFAPGRHIFMGHSYEKHVFVVVVVRIHVFHQRVRDEWICSDLQACAPGGNSKGRMKICFRLGRNFPLGGSDFTVKVRGQDFDNCGKCLR